MYVKGQLVLDKHDATFEPPSAFELLSLPMDHPVDVKFQDFQVGKLTAPRPEADREDP